MQTHEPLAFVTFIREHRADVLAQWEERVRSLPPAAQLDRQALVDHLPVILDELATAVEAALRGEPEPPQGSDSDRHAIARLNQGYDLGHVVIEYSFLRETILEMSAQHLVGHPEELRVFNRVLDDALGAAVDRYAETKQRMLAAVDRISTLALNVDREDEVLRMLLRVMMEAAPAVDEVTVLVCDGDRLHAREAVGITAERDASFSLAVGEGFAGTIAASRKPRFLRSAETDPLIASQFLRDAGVKALYGVPLVDGPEVIGVAHMGSLTAYEFPDEDMLLFRALANRASQLIIEARLKSQLREQHRELKLVLESAKVGTFSHELGQNALQCDERIRELFGLRPDEPATYERILSAIVPSDRAVVDELGKRGRPDSEFQVRYRVVLPDGEERHLAARGAFVALPEGRVRLVGIVQDRTEEAYAERERELFLAALGHDLRNPLQAITMGTLSLMRVPGLGEPVMKTLQRVARAGQRMSRLIEQLLVFARSRAGQPLTIERRRIDLIELWQEVLDEIVLTEPNRQILLHRHGSTFGEWDPDRMLQVFQNLAWNAVQYGDPARPIRVTLWGEGGQVVCEINNEGQTIPAELLPVLFDPFRRGKHRGRGLGLGLYIAKQIVEAHGGRIEARSTPAAGTTFRVTLPAA